MAFIGRGKSVEPKRTADAETVRMAAVALLGRRDFASNELREKLESQGYDPDVTAGVVAELIARHVLDDGRYAENYVAYHSQRGQGPVRIGADLRTLGVPAELIEGALAAGPDWRALAGEVRRRKFGPEPPENWSEKARQARFLQYRGFSADHIRSAVSADFDPDSRT